MRLSIIALASLIICAVFAAPILSGRDSDDGLSLLRRDPTGKASSKTAKTTPKTSSKDPASKEPASKEPTSKQPASKQNGNTAKSCPNKKLSKRADADVIKAVDFAIAESKKTASSSRVGRGAGKAYPIDFNGQPAFVKMVKEKDTTTRASVENEAKCADAVGQYLGWAVKEGKEEDGKKEPTLYFIITKNMGKEESVLLEAHKAEGLKKADFTKARPVAVKTYKDTFGATNTDANEQTGNNFVYKVAPIKKGEEPVVTGEIIDWELGKLDKEHAVPKAVEIAADC